MPRVKRREREIQRIREDILDASAKVFARVGYYGATMQEIAQEAGYTASSLYTYFEGKEAIFGALFERFHRDMLSVFDKPLPRGLTLEQSLELILNEALTILERRRDALVAFASVAQKVPYSSGLKMKGTVDEGEHAPIVARFIEWLEANAAAGELGRSTPEDAAYFLYGTVHSAMERWDRGGRSEQLTDLAPRALELFFHGVRGRSSDE